MSSIPSQGPLQTVLYLCENLHKSSSSSTGDASSLSLPLLVPLHQSLCHAVHLGRRDDEPAATPSLSDPSLPLEKVIEQLCTNPEDANLCRVVLLTNKKAARQQLATIQYLLFQDPLRSNPLQGLALVVIPWLLECFQLEAKKSEDHDDDMPHSIPASSTELLEAMMEAVYTTSETSVDGLQNCLDVCSKEVSSSAEQAEWRWTVQGRVLMRLHSWLSEKQSDQATNVLEILQNKCIQAIQIASTSKQTMVASLRPLTNDWLPYWQNHTDASGFHPLWECLWNTKNQRASTNESLLILSTTSVLCSILLSIAEEPLPVPQDPSSDKAIPFQQSCMWELIHTCLRQGIPRPHASKTDKWLAHEKEYQILRRRGLYLLRMMIPAPKAPPPQGKKKNKGQPPPPREDPQILLWKKYIQVMETLEMETEQHLIEQVWGTLTDVMEACSSNSQAREEGTTSTVVPPMTWHWTQLLLARVLTSYDQSMVRKLAVYRFLNGQAGVSLKAKQSDSNKGGEEEEQDKTTRSSKKGKGGKGKKKANNNKKTEAVQEGAPLTILTPEFVCDIVVVSFGSLVGSVGTNINMGTEVIDLISLLSRFLSLYYAYLEDAEQRRELVSRLWEGDFMEQLHTKTIVHVWECLSQAMATKDEHLETDASMLTSVVQALTHLFNTASVIGTYQDSLLNSLAIMLRHSKKKRIDPKIILRVLSLFDKIILEAKRTTTTSTETETGITKDDALDNLDTNPIHASLQQWLGQLGDTPDGDMTWISTVASSVASAFVRGDLLSSSQPSSKELHHWEPLSGASKLEREMARSVAYLGTLVGRKSTSTKSSASKTQTTAGELLWPAIHKGLANAPLAMVGTSWTNADSVTRSLLLLEEGCRLQVLSGMGNGDLVVDRKTQQMMPPPPNIESLLENAARFILYHISFLVADDPNRKEMAGASRSGDAKKASVTFANLISQIRMFHEAFPSSMAVGKIVDEMLAKSLDELKAALADQGADVVRNAALAYAALSCGASLTASTHLIEVCRLFLSLEFRKIPGKKKSEEQIGRSVFSFAKWGALSCLLPRLVAEGGDGSDVGDFLKDFREVAFEAVHGIPTDAMMAFFQCVTVAARREMSSASTPTGNQAELEPKEVDPSLIAGIIDALMTVLEERTSSQDSNYMLDEFCALIFQEGLLLQEFRRLQRDPAAAETPIRDCYRRLMLMAGTSRPRISRIVLCRVTVGWLGAIQEGNSEVNTQGMGAISFRKDIIDLLLHKESKLDSVTANQSVGGMKEFEGAFELPDGIDESSIGRGYALIFFSKLPGSNQGLHSDVQKLLVHHTILGLLDRICSDTTKKGANKLVMLGSDEYVEKSRGWQALCVLSRFVTDDIIETVSKRVFRAMGEALHQQIRYFLEVFTLQIARKHPAVIGHAILVEIRRRDLTLQNMTSVMIVAGNLIVGRYKLDFFTQYEDGTRREAVPLNQILAGTIPWLGSTQGFSRGIAQLLTHMLIPMVVDVRASQSCDASLSEGKDSNWFLISIYRFLDENQDMKRLRQKSSKFFDTYLVDEVCTPEGMLRIPVDEGGEAFPEHMVDTMKATLQAVYEEAHEQDFPQWKTLEGMLKEQEDESEISEPSDLVNFQRKIIPLDELNLALETLKERRQRNVAGRKKQKLVVCASLIDKVPNLGGLARTAEIFAAEKLVIPDLATTKMDNFKSLSVGAGEWIDIEECREENLLELLRSYRARNYFIIGVEQTSSSISLENYRFPDQPILLLLGKEKEGIPVEFLQAVDQCLEIPQMGLIRSLNVHVSGAIAIWEHTRQRMGQG